MSESTLSSSVTSVTPSPSSTSTGSLSGTPLRHVTEGGTDSSISGNSLSLSSYSPVRTGLTSSSSSPSTSPSRIPQRYTMPIADFMLTSSVKSYSTTATVSSLISSTAQQPMTFTTPPSHTQQQFATPMVYQTDSSTVAIRQVKAVVSPASSCTPQWCDSPSLSISSYSSTKTSPSSSSPQPLMSPAAPSSPPQQYVTDQAETAAHLKTSAVSSTDNSYLSITTASVSSATYLLSSSSNITSSSTAKSSPPASVAQSLVVPASTAVFSLEISNSSMAMTEERALKKLPHDEVQNHADTAMAKKADDNEMKRNLLSMVTKSQDKKKRMRALPNLQAMPPLKNPIESSESPIRAPPESLSSIPGGTLMLQDSLPLVDGSEKADSILPLSPVESWQSDKSPGGQLEIPTSPLSVEKTEPNALLKHKSPADMPLAMESLQPPTPSIRTISSHAVTGDDTRLAGFASETMMQQLLPEDGSSSSDFEVRNEVPLGQEMETKRDQSPQHDDSVDGSGNSIVSDRSLPIALGHVSHTNLEEVAATSLPDLEGQYKPDQK